MARVLIIGLLMLGLVIGWAVSRSRRWTLRLINNMATGEMQHRVLLGDGRASEREFLKGVRVDLSAMDVEATLAEATEIVDQLAEAGVNLVYLPPWSDGRANYRSEAGPVSEYGKEGFFEKLVEQARGRGMRVFGWYVVGKDDFLPGKNPEWFAKTWKGENYRVEDEPGLWLPMASLANDEYVKFHFSLVEEVQGRGLVDGWAVSEPLVGWSSLQDENYGDFSDSLRERFELEAGVDPMGVVGEWRKGKEEELFEKWVEFRASLVTGFVERHVEVAKGGELPVVVTLFVEPREDGRLDFDQARVDWGEDVKALVELDLDYVELQSAWLDFPYPQEPEWTGQLVGQFRDEFPELPPILVSVEAYPGGDPPRPVTTGEFLTALRSAAEVGVEGVNFYAYHLVDEEKWGVYKEFSVVR